jgi:hypothetical protein
VKSVKVVECVLPSPVPLIVIVHDLCGGRMDAVTVNVDVLPVVVAGENDPRIPLARPVADRLTALLKPPVREIVTV